MHGGMTGGSTVMTVVFVAMERSCPDSRNGQEGKGDEKLRKIEVNNNLL